MTTKNDVTGDSIVSKSNTDAYRDNWDKIFGKPDKVFEYNREIMCPYCGEVHKRNHRCRISMSTGYPNEQP